MILSFPPALNKYADLPSQSANPFVVRPGQLHVALRVLEGLVPQPLLQHGDRDAPEDAVAAVGGPEGVGVGPGRVDAHLEGCLFHYLAQALP